MTIEFQFSKDTEGTVKFSMHTILKLRGTTYSICLSQSFGNIDVIHTKKKTRRLTVMRQECLTSPVENIHNLILILLIKQFNESSK